MILQMQVDRSDVYDDKRIARSKYACRAILKILQSIIDLRYLFNS